MVQYFKVIIFGDCRLVYDGKRSFYIVNLFFVVIIGVDLDVILFGEGGKD